MFDFLVHEHDLHNLIWVNSAGLKTCDQGMDVAFESSFLLSAARPQVFQDCSVRVYAFPSG